MEWTPRECPGGCRELHVWKAAVRSLAEGHGRTARAMGGQRCSHERKTWTKVLVFFCADGYLCCFGISFGCISNSHLPKVITQSTFGHPLHSSVAELHSHARLQTGKHSQKIIPPGFVWCYELIQMRACTVNTGGPNWTNLPRGGSHFPAVDLGLRQGM